MMTFNKKRTSTPQAISPLKIDPTRSITLRRSFSQWLTNVFGQLKREIVDLVVTEDAFGLKKSSVAVWNQQYEDEDWEGEIQYPNPLSLMLNSFDTMDWETRASVLSTMTVNAFCATGPGGGVDPTCSPGEMGGSSHTKEAALKAVDKAPTVHANELTPGAARPGVLARGNLMANPLPTDISEKTAKKVKEVMNDSATVRTTKEVEIGSLVSLQSVVNKDSVKHFIKTDDREEQSHELPVVVRVGKKLYLYDGNHRTTGDLLAGRKTTKAVVYEKAKKKPTHNSFSEDPTLNTRWKYKSQSEAAEQFDQWLKGRLAIGSLSQAQKEKWKAFIQKGFEKGASRAFDDTTAARKKSALDSLRGVGFVEGRREQFIRQSISTATAVEKLRLLEQRALSELKGMTEEIRTKAKRAIMDGLVRRNTPKDIAAKLQTVLDISKGRAETIAYTELVRAHADGQLEAMEQLGVTEVGVAVEWTPREGACPLCTPMKGVVLSIQEAKGMIPRHPRCMCAFVPANIGEDKTEKKAQKRGKYKITKAITQSQKKEFKATGEVSDWGPNKPITKKRPESTVFNAMVRFEDLLNNVFCPTGEGGGIDPTCSPGGVVSGQVHSDQKADATWSRLFPNHSVDQVRHLVGAPSDATIYVESRGPDKLFVGIDHPTFQAERKIYKNSKGALIMSNDYIAIDKEHQGKGIGTEIFSKQVTSAKEMGISYIVATLTGGQNADTGQKYNGYYTWSVLGYDKPFSEFIHEGEPALLSKIKTKYPHAEKISDIIRIPGGAQWWKENGDTLVNARFHLQDGSNSLEILRTYQQAKKK